ncbi:MAG: helix-turn-helix domain-containing protein [Verrucomicrobia bacterium]|nr:helix-turn-helix domain-containing protein [Verrucomicrobiota bacterium]MCH8514506.1 helix-turn-helix domain-containing protein [Kiritimatiellia bacterium]
MSVSIAFVSETNYPFFTRVAAGIGDTLRRGGLGHLCEWRGSPVVPSAAVEMLNPDVVVAGAVLPSVCEEIGKKRPLIGCSHARAGVSWPRVVNHDVAVGQLGASALIEAGYSTLAILVPPEGHHHLERLKGALAVAKQEGIPVRVFQETLPLLKSGESFEEIWAAFQSKRRRFLLALPGNTGLLVCDSSDSSEVLRVLQHESNRCFPDEMGLVLADLPAKADLHLAHVALAAEEIGRRCVLSLLDWLRNPSEPPETIVQVDPLGVHVGETIREEEVRKLHRKLDAWCREHLREAVKVEDMASMAGMSRRSLEMKLNQHGLPSPYHLLTEIRMREARHLLASSRLSIEDIAEACGFCAAQALANRFRAHHGMAPSTWRKQHAAKGRQTSDGD